MFREVHASSIIFSHAFLQNMMILVMVIYILNKTVPKGS